MGRVCMGRLGNGPSLQWAEFAMGRDVQLPVIGIIWILLQTPQVNVTDFKIYV